MVLEDVTSGRLYETVQVGPLDANLPALTDDLRVAPPTYDDVFFREAMPGTPAWWVRRLLRKLDDRNEQLVRWDAYYRGDQPLAFASERFRDAFGGRFRAFSSNFCALVVDGTRERMEVSGFTFSSSRATKRAWRIWQDNDMDASSQLAHTEALVKGVAYALVEPDLFGDSPRLTIEDPLDAITESDPRDRRRRLAGLKRWRDEYGYLHLYLYLPETIWRLRTAEPLKATASLARARFVPDGVDFPMRNWLGVVPLVPLVNRPRLGDDGQSEVGPVMSNQDAVNKYRADALVAAEFAAFRQRWVIGLDIPIDPVTGRPVEPFKAAVDRLWVIPPPDPEDPNPGEAKFGEFSATDLAPYQRMIESEVGAISSISRLPYHYLLGQPQAVPPSGESLKSSEAGLIAKVKTQMTHFGEGWEETMRLALLAIGDNSGRDRTTATEWKDPETRNEAARTDSTVKAYAAGIIDLNEARLALGYQPLEEEVPPPTPTPAPAPAAPEGEEEAEAEEPTEEETSTTEE